MGVLKIKLKSSTLIEVVVAMLIAAICFSLAFATIGRLTAYRTGNTHILAEREVNNLIEKSLQEENYLKGELKYDNFYIRKTIESYDNRHDLLLIKIEALRPDGELLLERKRIVYEMPLK